MNFVASTVSVQYLAFWSSFSLSNYFNPIFIKKEYRERTLAAFKDGACPVLVATDVASRGLDVKGVSAVVNYDLANNTEDYVHRLISLYLSGTLTWSSTVLVLKSP
jgi:hypothetical protein